MNPDSQGNASIRAILKHYTAAVMEVSGNFGKVTKPKLSLDQAEAAIAREIERIIGEDDTSKQSPHATLRAARNELRAEQRKRGRA